mmetsp:Transcript_6802/g.18980  ORF Transcript_6802/g.18980 Transcript_6802/m.18980 type:complete len:282 (-) Transcript_6802:168-1013(-)
MGLAGDNRRLLVTKGILVFIITGTTSSTLSLGPDPPLGILGGIRLLLLLLVHAEPNPGRSRQRLADPALGRSPPLRLPIRRRGHGEVVGLAAAAAARTSSSIAVSARVVPNVVLVVVGPGRIEGLGGLRLLGLRRLLRTLRILHLRMMMVVVAVLRSIVVPLPAELRLLLRVLLLHLLGLRRGVLVRVGRMRLSMRCGMMCRHHWIAMRRVRPAWSSTAGGGTGVIAIPSTARMRVLGWVGLAAGRSSGVSVAVTAAAATAEAGIGIGMWAVPLHLEILCC